MVKTEQQEQNGPAPAEGSRARGAPEPEGQKVSDRYNSPNADVTLISSDKVTFRLDSHDLKAASPVLRAMLQPYQTLYRIELSNEVLEHNVVLTELFNIITDQEVKDFEKTRLIGHAIDLANKWKCDKVLKTIEKDLRLRITSDNPEDDAAASYLQIAGKLGAYDIIAEIIKRWGEETWGDGEHDEGEGLPGRVHDADPFTSFKCQDLFKNSNKGKAIKGGKLFEPGTMLLSDYCRIPPLVHWAIARSLYNVAGPDKREIAWDKVSKEFKKLIDEANAGEEAEGGELGNRQGGRKAKRARMA